MIATERPAPSRNKVAIAITLDPDQIERIDAIVGVERTNRSAVIRRALEHYLDVYDRTQAVS